MPKSTSNELHISVYGLWPEMKDHWREKMKGKCACVFHDEILSDKNIDKETEILVVFVDSQVTKDAIAKMPNLKAVATLSTGYDHIDIAECAIRKIPVCYVPTYGENTVAEHAFALILCLTRRIFDSVKKVKEGVYDFHGLRGMDLRSKTLGVIGTGHIGMHVIRMAKGFEMNVVAYDLYPNKKATKEFGFKYLDLGKLLASSDIITLHAPLTEQTKHLINKNNIGTIKKGALIINTARGGLIETEALVKALENGDIGGVGIDVLEEEGLLQNEDKILRTKITPSQIHTGLLNKILINHPKAVVTPHNAFNSTEAVQRIIDTTVENIEALLAGKTQNNAIK